MIFVTVGTHEQQFNRLVEYIDNLKGNQIIDEDVVIQTGFSTYEPKHCKWQKLFSYQEMMKLNDEARIIITHGGPSSFISALQRGKVPVVVPRWKKFDEHINDHQVTFGRVVAERNKNIILIEDIEKLKDVLLQYDDIVANMPKELKSNNALFCNELSKIVDEIMA